VPACMAGQRAGPLSRSDWRAAPDSTQHRANARGGSEKRSAATGARRGERVHGVTGTRVAREERAGDRRERRTSSLTLWVLRNRAAQGAARGGAALGGLRHMRGMGAVPGRD